MNRTRTSKNAKRLLVWLLLLTMVFGLLPMAAFADETVVETVVSEEPVQEPEPSSEPTEAPSEPTQEPTQEPEPEQPGNAVVTIEGDEEQPEDDVDAEDEITTLSTEPIDGFDYSIVMVDCGRKYYSVDSINSIITSAANAKMHYVMLAVGNDGLRFLLDDMSLSFNGAKYTSEQVTKAIHAGNQDYDTRKGYNPGDKEELTETDMVKIMEHANSVGVQIIPLINTPGHMDAILYAMGSGTDALNAVRNPAYSTSKTTINIADTQAVDFTQALLQKYITFFASKGCTLFNMGADEYGNDVNKTPHFSDIVRSGDYKSYIAHINAVASMVGNAGMTPMAFNDGIYYNKQTGHATINNNIIVCYWSCGWNGYDVAPAYWLSNQGFKLVNTHGDYYWIVGDNQCSESKARGFDIKTFPAKEGDTSTIDNPSGAMFCIWSDTPGAESDTTVAANTASVISAFGGTLPETKAGSQHYGLTTSGGGSESGGGSTGGGSTGGETQKPGVTVNLTVGDTKTETQKNVNSENSVGDYNTSIVKINAKHNQVDGETKRTLGSIVSFTNNKDHKGVITDGNDNYMVITDDGSIENTNDINEATVFTVNRSSNYYYTIKGNGKYLTVNSASNYTYSLGSKDTSDTSNTFYYSTTYGFYDYNYVYVTYSDGWTASAYGYGNARLYSYTESATDPVDETTITFEGIKPGTTTCKIGDTLYTINVSRNAVNKTVMVGESIELTVTGTLSGLEYLDDSIASYVLSGNTLTIAGKGDGKFTFTDDTTEYTIEVTTENLENVDPITFEFWVTNCKVTALDKDGVEHGESIAISAADVHLKTGVATKDLMYEDGYRTTDSEKAPHVFWKTTRLTDDKKQTLDKGDNKTTSGNDFTYIRYWNGKWAFSNDQINWTEINDTDQIVAYYLLQLTVTDEVTTQVTDWGVVPHNNFNSSDFVLMDFAVKYESSGVRTPNTFPQSDKTVAFHCDSGDSVTVHYDSTKRSHYRDLGMVRGVETKDYEVYMITVTPSKSAITRSYNTYMANAYTYDYDESTGEAASEKVVWVDDEANLPAEFRDTSTHYTSISGKYNYSVGGEAIVPGVEIYNTYGMLITYYVRAKATPDSLKVVYINKNNNEEFYSYNIAVKQGTTFAGVQLPETKIDGVSALTNGRVENLQGNYEYVSSDLSTMPAIGAEFRYGGYECVQVTESEDHKTVTLYYTFNYNKTFVVDFGLPLIIEPGNVNDKLERANITKVEIAKVPTSGTATVETRNVRYKLNEMLAREDSMTIKYTGTNVNNGKEDNVPYNISIIPASNVYYEDSFVKFNPGTGAAAVEWSTGTTTEATQSLSTLDSKDVYGYDEAYKTSTKFSMGSARKVTVTSDMASGWDANVSTWPTATFTFKGTGFDIISLTDNTSGTITVDVYAGENAEGEPVKSKFVNDYFGYEYKNGDWSTSTTADGNNALYQIPVMKITGLDYGQYTVVVTVFYDDLFNSTGTEKCSFWFDAVRVYNPLGEDTSRYEAAGEGYPQYIKLRDEIAKKANDLGTATAKTLLFVDGVKEANVDTYKNIGPNNEVYLAKDQSISFKLKSTDNIASVQIGAKAPANIGTANMVVSYTADITKEINTATEMYYEITDAAKDGGLVTITNTGDAILSLTNIKITYNKQTTTTLAELSDDDAAEAVATVRALFSTTEPEQPEKTFEPSRFDCEWSKNVRKGGRAILTVKASTDVESILIDGEAYGKYVTRTERIGWGRNAQRVTYHEFIYMTTADEVGTINTGIVAVNGEGVQSAAKTVPLIVKGSSPIRDWIGGLFGRWF